jgi:hypothetical protein
MFLEACSNYSVSEGNRGEILRVFDYSHSNIHGHISKQRLAEVDTLEWKVFGVGRLGLWIGMII